MEHYRLLHPVRRDRHGMIHIARGPDGGPAAVRVLPGTVPAATRALFTGLRHPNLARVLDVVTGDGEVLVAEEAVLGRTLRRPFPAEEFPRIATGIAAGLHHLHRNGITHGTLCSASVLVERGGTVRLTDLAVGTLTGDTEDDLRALGQVLAGLWRDSHRPWQRPPALVRSLCAGDIASAAEVWHEPHPTDVWANTMARARNMG